MVFKEFILASILGSKEFHLVESVSTLIFKLFTSFCNVFKSSVKSLGLFIPTPVILNITKINITTINSKANMN